MRPTAKPQSALRAPLNDILGTEANVRVLRVLTDHVEPMVAAELARQAELQPSTVHRSLKALELTGIAEFNNLRSRVALRDSSPLTRAVRELFRAERARHADVVEMLRLAALALKRQPIAVWIEGKVAAGVDLPTDAIVVGLVDDARELDRTRDLLRLDLDRIEATSDVTIEVRGRTLADFDAAPSELAIELRGAIPLAGIPPSRLLAKSAGDASVNQ